MYSGVEVLEGAELSRGSRVASKMLNSQDGIEWPGGRQAATIAPISWEGGKSPGRAD